MRTIHKYPLVISDYQQLYLPSQHRLLSVAEQSGSLCLWAEVETDSPRTHVGIRIVGTGNSIAPNEVNEFIGTVQTSNGFVWHIFKKVA